MSLNPNTSSALESEVVIYAKIGDMAGLNKADRIESQLQLDGRFENGSRCRVRRTFLKNTRGMYRYEFTYKIDQTDGDGISIHQEFTVPVDQAFFEGFERVADHYVSKTRYIFLTDRIELASDAQVIDVPNVKYEVDVYKNKEGEVCDWCKIDIEVDELLKYLDANHPGIGDVKLNVRIKHLPFKPFHAMIAMSADEDQKQFIQELWQNQYNIPLK